MEDAIKALEMAAGVLLAVIIMTLIAYFFSSIKNLPQEQDQSTQAEQLAKFNLEYEVYNKKAMYGVDVISCLNKAQSNNEKYVIEKDEHGKALDRFLAGSKYGELYSINVFVKLTNGALEETLEIYHYDKNAFLHAKTVVIDDKICSVGTANMDTRSFTLNFEVNAFIYSENISKKQRELFEDDMKKSKELTLEEYNNRSRGVKFKEGFSKLFSALL